MSCLDLARELRGAPVAGAVSAWVVAALEERPPVAVRHPLGFTCLPISRGALDLCVHVWTAGVRRCHPTTSPIHCHSWDLRSYVLYGELRNQLVGLDEGPATHRVFEVRSTGDTDELRPTGRVGHPRRCATTTHRAGEAYEIPAGTFHLTDVPERHEAATVVLAGPHPGVVDLSLGAPDTPAHTVARQRCDSGESAAVVATVVQRLRATRERRRTSP